MTEMKSRLLPIVLLATVFYAGTVNQQARSQAMDRTALPIKEPVRQTYKELDARNVKAPERFEVKAPKGAPNVVVILIDDIGFGASDHFGGPIAMPVLDKLGKNGLSYNRFHTTALCSPTRVAILTGYNHHSNNAGSIMETATTFPGNNGVRPQALHRWRKYFVKMVSVPLRLASITKLHHGKFLFRVLWIAGPHIPALINSMDSLEEKPINGLR